MQQRRPRKSAKDPDHVLGAQRWRAACPARPDAARRRRVSGDVRRLTSAAAAAPPAEGGRGGGGMRARQHEHAARRRPPPPRRPADEPAREQQQQTVTPGEKKRSNEGPSLGAARAQTRPRRAARPAQCLRVWRLGKARQGSTHKPRRDPAPPHQRRNTPFQEHRVALTWRNGRVAVPCRHDRRSAVRRRPYKGRLVRMRLF